MIWRPTSSDSRIAPTFSMLRCGTENETWTLSRLPKVPRQALSRMLPISVITSRGRGVDGPAAAPVRWSGAL